MVNVKSPFLRVFLYVKGKKEFAIQWVALKR